MKCNPPKPLRHRPEGVPSGATIPTDQPADRELLPSLDPEESGDLDDVDTDDERWDAFLADDDELDPTPEHGDFWPESD